MTDLSSFPITRKWPARHPDRLQLYSLPRPTILLYLADKARMFIPQDPAARYQTIQWLMFQMGGVGPMFGQVGFFTRALAAFVARPAVKRGIEIPARG